MQFIPVSKQHLAPLPLVLWLALLLFCQLTFSPIASTAANLSTSAPFQQGKISFKKGEYGHALDLFKQARAQGLNKPSLFYNIGVCAYKLEFYSEAEEAFLLTSRFPKMAALAYYNLGVVAEKQDDTEAALSWLKKSIVTAGQKDDKIRLLAQTALSRIQIKQGLIEHWTSYAAVGYGYDDNVSMTEGDDLLLTSEEEDGFTDYFAFVRSPFLGNAVSEGPFLQASISARDYSELNEYDVGSLNLAGKYRKKIGEYRLEGGMAYNYIMWDDSTYSQSPILSLQLKRPFGEGSSWRLRYEGKYLDHLDSTYSYLNGRQHRATTELVTKFGAHKMVIGYRFEENDRRDEESSPRRHLINARLELYPLDSVFITFAASYRDSTYDLVNISDREEDRYEGSLQLGYTLSKNWEVTGRYTRTVNHSTDDLYDYKRDVTSLSLGYTF